MSFPPPQNVGTLNYLSDPSWDQPFVVATQCSTKNTPLITTAIMPGSTWATGWDYVLFADGCQQWSTPNNEYYDLTAYHSGLGEYTFSAGFRAGPTATVKMGKLVLGSTSTSTGTRVAALGNNQTMSGTDSVGIGNNNVVSGTNCLAVGNNCTASGSNNFAGGSGGSATGVGSNFAFGSQVTSGANNFALCQGRVSTSTTPTTVASNNSGCIGDGGQVIGSTKCYLIGADLNCKIDRSAACSAFNSGTNVDITSSSRCTIINGNQAALVGRTGSVLMTDGNTSSSNHISPGGDYIFQCRFNGGGVVNNNSYWFASDIIYNGVRMAYGANSWSPISSDSRLKTAVDEFEYEAILPCFERVPVYRYKYKTDDESYPLRTGFYADDFNSAFEGYVERQLNKDHPYSVEHPEESPIETYSFGDLSQVNFAGIRGLYAMIKKLNRIVMQQQRTIDELQSLGKIAQLNL
uniref:Glycosidase n=1 Tax=Clandestinovirus TaxID=2831644 RepID=A0A8F8KP37_9VIRU|nr:glycosidase [Clandestinovirus]